MAYWYQKEKQKEPENLTMWTRDDAPYLINLRNPQMQKLYFAEKRRLGHGHNAPLGDVQRWAWEIDVISRFADVRTMPEHIVRRLLLPPYRNLCTVAGIDIAALERHIKKGPPKRSAVS